MKLHIENMTCGGCARSVTKAITLLDDGARVEADPASRTVTVQTSAAPAAPKTEGARIFASPLARRIAAEKGLDLASVQGSGPHGRIMRADVEVGDQQQGAGADEPLNDEFHFCQ